MRSLNYFTSLHPLRCILKTKSWQNFTLLQSKTIQYLENALIVPDYDYNDSRTNLGMNGIGTCAL